MPRRKRVKKRGVKARSILQWFAYLLIVSVPIAVLIIGFYPPTAEEPKPAWTRTWAENTRRTEATTFAPTPRMTAAILDQVAAYNVNEGLIRSVGGYLSRAGYRVDVFSGTQVTVDLYRRLPSEGYGVIILRVHSTSTVELGEGQTASGAPVFLLTGEPYNHLGYPYEQTMGRVRPVKIDAGTFFGIGPDFVAASMEGTFPGTLIIIAGCESLANVDLAKALVARGASRVVGWSGSVGLDHNDKAILSLTRDLFERELSLAEAIRTTMNEIGKDPTFESFLLSYP